MKKLLLVMVCGMIAAAGIAAEVAIQTGDPSDAVFEVEGVEISSMSELSAIEGGRDPDQGYDGNFTRTMRDYEIACEYPNSRKGNSFDRDAVDVVNTGLCVIGGVVMLVASPTTGIFWLGAAAATSGGIGSCRAGIADRRAPKPRRDDY
jgi:hypothetical protein